MKNFVSIHPEVKWSILGLYLIIDKDRDQVIIKHHRLSRVGKGTLKAQTKYWPLLRELLFFCRDRILENERFEKISIPKLAHMQPEEIVEAIIKS